VLFPEQVNAFEKAAKDRAGFSKDLHDLPPGAAGLRAEWHPRKGIRFHIISAIHVAFPNSLPKMLDIASKKSVYCGGAQSADAPNGEAM